MPTPLLRTKLYIPPPRPRERVVPRPRLIEQLDRGLTRKLTLISAPAGFGKTTLLSQWIARGDLRPRVAWLSLDKEDNDPALFWSYLIAALQTVQADLGADLLAAMRALGPQPPPFDSPLVDLINEIAASGADPLSLVLDDFHVITNSQIIEDMARLLDNLPPRLHLVLSSRADPPWVLARLRARGQMIELRAGDLRFTPAEVSAFLNDAMGLDLSAENILALDARTEGWIAGLQLAAISIQGRDAGAFISAFSGSHRFVLDYLVEEVLDRQPPAIREFLLETSILERMTATLCNAVLQRVDSQTILSQLERSNMFIVPLDDERRWYRYHRLFADLLHSRHDQIPPAQLTLIHGRASEWYEQNGGIALAVNHALAAADIERVARLVEGNATALVEHRELKSLIRRLDALADEVFSAHPWLCIAYAWVLSYAGRVESIEPLLQRAEQGLDRVQARAELRSILGRVAHLRGYVADLQGDSSRSLQFSREALDQLAEDDSSLRAYTLSAVGTSLRKLGDLTGAAQAFTEGVTLSRAAGDTHVSVMVLCRLATLQIWQGQLHQASITCQDALSLSREYAEREGHPLPVAGYAEIQLSRLLCEWNDLAAAHHHARRGIELCSRWGQADIQDFGHYHLARILYRQRDLAELREQSQIHRQVVSMLPALYAASATEVEMMVRMLSGDLEGAFQLAQEQGMGPLAQISRDQYHHLFTTVRLLIALGKLDESLELLARLLSTAEATGARGYLIELLVLQAVALQARGERDQALTALARALALAEPENYLRVFIDGGAPMGALLQGAADRGIAAGYVRKLLAALAAETPGARALYPPLAPSPPPLDALTERELQVLQLLATDLPTAEIADQLVISINTLRTHTKRIYSKLGARSRLQAVAQARDQNLI